MHCHHFGMYSWCQKALEPEVHGRGRDPNAMDDLFFGVHDEMLYARKSEPIQGAQWTGIVTAISMEMLRANIVDAVICVQSDPNDRFSPRPVLARLSFLSTL
jgi:7-hydroxymethyl chlorophyll a reductase